MKISTNGGKHREATAEEIALRQQAERLPYKDRVIARIRAVYSVDDEIAIIRQRDIKPFEFEEYNKFVEQIKAEEKER